MENPVIKSDFEWDLVQPYWVWNSFCKSYWILIESNQMQTKNYSRAGLKEFKV